MHSVKVRSLLSTMALFTPTHFLAYNGNRRDDIHDSNVFIAILSIELSSTLMFVPLMRLSVQFAEFSLYLFIYNYIIIIISGRMSYVNVLRKV